MITLQQRDAHISVRDLVAKYGNLTAINNVSFEVYQGEHLTLLGPSGCGKTTLLRCIAGLETPASGEITIERRPVFSSLNRVNIPPERRGISMVFQSYAIWPHMTVFDNVAYGLRVRRLPEKDVECKVMHALDLVRLKDLARKSASKLSGGQQQRVALARSFAFDPKVLLFDEPLSNLDAKLRAEMRIELKEIQRQLGITSVYVTHDQEEALAISDRILVMNVGFIEQVGTPVEIYDIPRTAFVADFVGAANIIPGHLRRDLAINGVVAVETDCRTLVYCARPSDLHEGKVNVSIRTVYLDLLREKPSHDQNVWPVQVARRVFLGDFVQYILNWQGGQLIARKPPIETFSEGEMLYVKADPKRCVIVG